MRLTPQQKISTAFVAAMSVAVVIGMLAYWSASRTRDAATWVAHSEEVVGALLAVVTAETRFLTAERAYLITGDDTYLETYDEAVASAGTAIRKARELTANDPSRLRRVQVLGALIDQLEGFTGRLMRTRRDQGFQQAAALLMSGSGERLQQAIGANVSGLIAEERGPLAQRRQRMDRTSAWALDLILAGTALAVLIGWVADTRTRHSFAALQQAEGRFRALMDSAPDAMLVVDEKGGITLVNARAESLFGYNRQELTGKSIEIVIPERYRTRHAAHRGSYAQAPVLRPMGANLELFARRRDGSEFPVEVSLSPVVTPAGLQVASAIRDISERKRTLEQLRDARAAAEKADRAKSTFLATASHDLRQPLQTLSLLNGALRRTVRDAGPAEALAQQEAAIGVMSRLLNALLDISKLESGAVKPMVTNWQVVTLFDQLRSEFANLAQAKRLQLEVDGSCAWVRSDLSLVGQVLRNLVSNAIKYTQRGSVHLHAAVEGEEVRVEVRDTGIGMAPEELDHIYGDFYQIGVPTNATRDGYGLGLSIVSRIVKLLSLRLEVLSEVGKGSTFALTLPVGTATAGSIGGPGVATALERGAGRAHHVLVVDDEPAVLNATRLLLMAEGYRVRTATSVAQAVAVARESVDLELVLTDYHLAGGETGRQVIAAVRQIRGASLKAVLITGDTSSAARGVEGDGNLRFLSKPVDPNQLLELVAELLAAPAPVPEQA